MKSPAIAQLVESFIADIEVMIVGRKAELVAAALAEFGPAPRAPRDFPTNPDGHKSFRVVLPFPRARKKAPIQLCPAPGCVNRAAPVFKMLCRAHKDASFGTVTQWRLARRGRKGR